MKDAKCKLLLLEKTLSACGYVVQTLRISLNSFEIWNPIFDFSYFELLINELNSVDIEFCYIGTSSSSAGISQIPLILSKSNKLYCSASLIPTNEFDLSPDFDLCISAAVTCKKILNTCGNLGNFRYYTTFNSIGIPYFPPHSTDSSIYSVSLCLECADLLFLSFFGADSLSEAQSNLLETLKQAFLPIQNIIEKVCEQNNLFYQGIDASVYPGSDQVNSTVEGIEILLQLFQKENNDFTHRLTFGSFGTLTVITLITKVLEILKEDKYKVKLTGLNSVMISVMEDAVLSLRVKNNIKYKLRDLISIGSLGNVIFNTIPISDSSTIEEISRVYLDMGTIAFGQKKPISLMLMPIRNKQFGEYTELNYPFLYDTTILCLD